MKVSIGPYTNWIGPYQIAEMLMFWVPKEKDEYGFPHTAKRVHEFGRWLSEDRHGNDSILTKVCNWIESKKKRKIKIQIDRYDTWSMDHTLALIIHPMLIQLKETKHGSPFVDDEDVPEHLRSTAAPPKENEWDTDNNHHLRWEWILDEITWAFSQILDDTAEDQFHSGKIDIQWKKVDKTGNPLPDNHEGNDYLCEMVKGPDDTHTFDHEGYKKWNERKANGFRLFGKYYQALWD